MTSEPRRVSGMSSVIELREIGRMPEFRAASADSDPGFIGHAAVFNTRTAIGNPLSWGFYEQLSDGAFTKTLKEGDARFLVDHDSSKLVGRVSAGDLRLAEDSEGLAVDADLDTELSYVRDLVRNLDKRRITGMSFGFQVVRDDWDTETVEAEDSKGNKVDAEVEVRTIQEVRLLEVSAVTFPAYPTTDAGLRSMVSEIRSARQALSPSTGDDSSPASATRSEDEDASAEATRQRVRILTMRSDLLRARYRIP